MAMASIGVKIGRRTANRLARRQIGRVGQTTPEAAGRRVSAAVRSGIPLGRALAEELQATRIQTRGEARAWLHIACAEATRNGVYIPAETIPVILTDSGY